jgi:hypothetical protein
MSSYIIKPLNKKSILDVEKYYKKIEEENYYLYKNTIYRTGELIINLKDNEELPETDIEELIISDYEDYELLELIDSYSIDYEIYNSERRLIYEGEKYNKIIEEIIKNDNIEENGWKLYDTEYIIYKGYSYEKIKE